MIPLAQAIVEFLKTQGVRYVFGKVGEGLLPILDSLASQGSIKFISVSREENAVLMADGYARTERQPGIALVSGGSGAAQTVSALGQAFYDGSPVILFSSESPAVQVAREGSKAIEQSLLFRNLTRHSCRVANPRSAVQDLEQIYRSAMSGRKGPAYCGIPTDFLAQETSERIRHHSKFMSLGLNPADPELIRQASELLIKSQRPVILLGGGTVWSQAATEAMDLAEFLFAPIAISNGKSGIVPDDYPLSIGRLGSKANKVALETVAEADVVISFGCTFDHRTTLGPAEDLFSPDMKMIQVDIDPHQIGRFYPIEIGIVGDARWVLRGILACLREMGIEKWPSKVIQRMQMVWKRKEAWNNQWSRPARSADKPIHRLRLLKDLVDELGREGIIFGELEWKHCLNTSFFPLIESHDFPVSGAHLPFAMGAKLALPDRPVVAFLGDGQFMAILNEITTAVEHHVPILTIVAHNGCYGRAKATQTQFHDGRYIGVDHKYPDLADVSLCLGAYAERVENPLDIRPAIRRALDCNRPAVVEVLINGSIGDLKPVFD
jgi:thiamine pyrophosphate-dependent acetolactate synthase large subunit-like protein